MAGRVRQENACPAGAIRSFPVSLAPRFSSGFPFMAKLRPLAPLIRKLDTRTTPLPARKNDPTYFTPEYQVWRAQVVARAGGRCEAMVDGHRCSRAQPEHRLYADHIRELKDGGSPYDISNGMLLCGSHHEIKTFDVRIKRLRS